MLADADRSLEKIYDQHADPLSMVGSILTGQSKPPGPLSRMDKNCKMIEEQCKTSTYFNHLQPKGPKV